MPRKLAQAGMADGCRSAKTTEMITVTNACRRQMAVIDKAVRYVGPVEDWEDTGAVGSVGEVARGK